MTVHARSEHARGAAAARRLARVARRYLAALALPSAELSLLVVGDRAIRSLNRRWRGKDRATDVLSFPAAGPGPLLGDVVVSLDTARRAAAEAGRALGDELDRYLAHGLLHLLGHDHERPADARRMAQAEDALVGQGMVSAARGSAPSPWPSPPGGERESSRGGSRRRAAPRLPSPRAAGRGVGGEGPLEGARARVRKPGGARPRPGTERP